MKFSSDLAEQLYGETPDEQSGSVEELGWFGLFKKEQAILTEDSQGFVDVEQFSTETDLNECWELLALSTTV